VCVCVRERQRERKRVCVCVCVCVCVSSQVYNTLQMVYTEALRSLTHFPPPPLQTHLSLCVVNLTRGMFSAFLTTAKLLWLKTQEGLKCNGGANQATSERQQSKRDFKQLLLLRGGNK